jgi:hypothetical protein
VEFFEHLFQSGGGVAGRQGGGQSIRPQGKGHRGELLCFDQAYGSLLEVDQGFPQSAVFELFFENFPLGLEKEEVVGIVAFEDFEKQSSAGLKLALSALLPAGQ